VKYLIEVVAAWCLVSLAVVLYYDARRLFGDRGARGPWPFEATAFGCLLAGLLYVIRAAFNAEQLRLALSIAGAVAAVVAVTAAVLALRGKR
jgi:hypothetical protein